MLIAHNQRPSLSKEKIYSLWPHLRYMTRDFILGIRGYSTLETTNVNRRGIYDDALFIIGKNVFKAFCANTDPSDYKKGRAVLQSGVYEYQIGVHNRNAQPPRKHEALIQARKVKIKRDGASDIEEGFFGINIHRGGKLHTGSEGCQTIPAQDWPEFINSVKSLMSQQNLSFIHYCLVEVDSEKVSIQSI